MSSETDLAWLAGFLDADGMIRLKIGMKNERGPKSLIPFVNYTNTCMMTATRLAKMVGDIVDFKVTVGNGRASSRWNPKTVVEIAGLRRVFPFLTAVRPYLVTKAVEADLLLRFARLRYQNRQRPYGGEEYLIFHALKYLKVTRHLRDYMPSIEQVLNEDIVRTNAKALEAAEMPARLSIEERKEFARTLVAKYRWAGKDTAKRHLAAMQAFVAEGLGPSEIGRRLGLTRQTVYRVLKEALGDAYPVYQGTLFAQVSK